MIIHMILFHYLFTGNKIDAYSAKSLGDQLSASMSFCLGSPGPQQSIKYLFIRVK